jgi:hypothetical protein
MNRHDIHLLQQVRGYPALTITLPTHGTAPDNQQDPIRVRNLVTEATNRLLNEFGRREIEPLLSQLERLVSEIDFRYTLALFVTQNFARVYQIPFDLQERIKVVLSKQGRVVFVDTRSWPSTNGSR